MTVKWTYYTGLRRYFRKAGWKVLDQMLAYELQSSLTHWHFLGKRRAEERTPGPSGWWRPRTFKCHPVLLPFPPGHQFQLPFLLQGDEGFEEQPPSLAHHPLFLLKEQVQLLQRAEWPAAGLGRLRGRLEVLRVGPAHLQLSHEILVNVLLEGVAADRMSGFASVGQDMSGAPCPQGRRPLGGPLRVHVQPIRTAVKVVTALLGPRLLWATQMTTHQRLRIAKAPLSQHGVHVIVWLANRNAAKQESFFFF